MRCRRISSRFVIALFALLGQLAGYAHLAAVQHVTCEHGDYVELHASVGDDVVHMDHADLVAVSDEDHDHDHCTATPNARHGSLIPDAARAALSLLATADGSAHFAAAALPAQIPLHRLAPKNSPPVV